MKNSRLLFFVAIIAMLIVSACGPAQTGEDPDAQYLYRNQLADTGLFGQHGLESLTASEGVSGSFSGRYFVGGYIKGEVENVVTLRFKWSPLPGEYVTSAVHESKFRTIINNSLEEPMIEFVFKDEWLNSYNLPSGSLNYGPMTATEKANVNVFVESPDLVLVRVYISAEDRAKEPLLP